ncbi:Ubiquitin-like-specific protease 1D [Linum grandiflorum]
MADADSSKKRKLVLDWEDIDRQTDGKGSLPEVVSEKNSRASDDRRQSNPSPPVSEPVDPDHYSLKDECARMTDRKLEESIDRQKKTLATVGRTLPDGGRKIRAAVKILEDEREKRKSDRARLDIDKAKQPAQLANSGLNGEYNCEHQPGFTSLFRKKMEDDVRSDCKPFDRDLSALGRGPKVQSSDGPSQKARQRNEPSRQWPFQSSRRASVNNRGSKNVDISPGTFYARGERIAKKQSNGDDQDSVQVCYKDIRCLAPESLVKSPVINFYIRYLELHVIPTKKSALNYHIFNTYFYSKLKQELSKKGNEKEKESLFIRFRKWWKGVNLFEKAYVLIPIHEDNHWSLVIICFPEKEDKSELILLHLDSLKLHRSRDIFDVIKSCLREEWKCLHKDVAPNDLQMSENRILNRLPNICSRSVEVPQQGNEYDCGIFVLCFMERFIEEAPERLKRQDLSLFSQRWFNTKEATRLRYKIREMLKTEFRNARKEACSSNGALTATG